MRKGMVPSRPPPRPRSVCCYYPRKDGNCLWCGKPSEAVTYANRPELVGELEALLCDWNAPSRLDTTDLRETISKVFTFIKRKYLAGEKEEGK